MARVMPFTSDGDRPKADAPPRFCVGHSSGGCSRTTDLSMPTALVPSSSTAYDCRWIFGPPTNTGGAVTVTLATPYFWLPTHPRVTGSLSMCGNTAVPHDVWGTESRKRSTLRERRRLRHSCVIAVWGLPVKTHIVTSYLSMLARQSCYVAISLGCLASPLKAQENASALTAAAPSYKVGDSWTIIQRRTDAERGTPYVLAVVAVTEHQTTLSSSWNGGPLIEIDLNNQGNMTRDAHGTTYEPSDEGLHFPMTVGQTWDFHHIQRFTGGTLDVSGSDEIVAFERVHVAAGSFEAFKIVSHGINAKQEVERLSSIPFTRTYWYAPIVKKVVKSDYTLYLRPPFRQTSELSAFSLAP